MANFAAVGIQREREAKFRQRLERYHSPQVVDQILRSSQSKEAPALQAQRCQISVLFADISGLLYYSQFLKYRILLYQLFWQALLVINLFHVGLHKLKHQF